MCPDVFDLFAEATMTHHLVSSMNSYNQLQYFINVDPMKESLV